MLTSHDRAPLPFSERKTVTNDLKSVRLDELDTEYDRERRRLSKLVERLKHKIKESIKPVG